MKRPLFVRMGAFALCALLATIAALSVTIVPDLSGRLTDTSGRPLAGAYVAYRLRGSRFNFVDSLSYQRPGTIVRTNSAGEYRAPGFIEIHKPLDSGLHPWIEWVYAPGLHHAFGPIAAMTESVPGVIDVDTAPGTIRLADLTDDPERWSRTLDLLRRAVRRGRSTSGGRVPGVAMSGAMSEALHDHLRSEYRALMQRHARTPREVSEPSHIRYLPEQQRQLRMKELRAALEREPLWGQLLERRWGDLAKP